MSDALKDPAIVKAMQQVVADQVALVHKAAVQTIREHKAKLDADHDARKPSVQVWPVHEVRAPDVTVNVAALPVDLVVKALHDLAAVANTMPIPVVEGTTINVEPTPVTFDLSVLTAVVEDLQLDQAATRQMLGTLTVALGQLAAALAGMDRTNRALLAAVNRPKRARSMRIEYDDRGNAVLTEVA